MVQYMSFITFITLHDFCERGNARQGTIIVYLKVIINVRAYNYNTHGFESSLNRETLFCFTSIFTLDLTQPFTGG